MQQLDEEKLFYERFWALHRNEDLVAVCKEFGIGAFRRSSVLENFEKILKDNNISGRRCLEIGTFNGLTAVVLSRLFDSVVTIDIAPTQMKHDIVRFLGIKNIQFIEVRNNEDKVRAVQQIGPVDFAYVDADHARDTDLDFRLVRDCGRVLFHEYWEAQPAVYDLVNRLSSLGQGSVVIEGKMALWTA